MFLPFYPELLLPDPQSPGALQTPVVQDSRGLVPLLVFPTEQVRNSSEIPAQQVFEVMEYCIPSESPTWEKSFRVLEIQFLILRSGFQFGAGRTAWFTPLLAVVWPPLEIINN